MYAMVAAASRSCSGWSASSTSPTASSSCSAPTPSGSPTASWGCPTRWPAWPPRGDLSVFGMRLRAHGHPRHPRALVARAAHRHPRDVDHADEPRHPRLRHPAQGGADDAVVAPSSRSAACASRGSGSRARRRRRHLRRARSGSWPAPKLGKAMRAMSQNREACAVVGVDVQRVAIATFALSAALAAAAAALVSPLFNIFPDMGALLTLKAFAAVIAGGFGYVNGAIAASFLIGVAESLAARLRLLRLQGRHRLRGHDRGAARGGHRACSAGGSASERARRAARAGRRPSWSPRRGSWPPSRPGAERYILHVLDLHRALRRPRAQLRPRRRPRRQPVARPPGVLRRRRLHRGPARHRGAVAVPRRAPRRGGGGRARRARSSACRCSGSPSTRSPWARSASPLVAQIVATNWVEFTRGPLCITGIPKPAIGRMAHRDAARLLLAGPRRAGRGRRSSITASRRSGSAAPSTPCATTSRWPRPPAINPLKYRMLAFVIGGALAGGVGALYVALHRRAVPGGARRSASP